MKNRFATLILLLGGLVLGCDRVEVDDGGADDGRVVLGESVDGVRLGDDTLALAARWGPPSRITRGAGNFRYHYDEGAHAGVEVYYDVEAGGRLSPRNAIRLVEPYAGRTRDGVGLGSRRSDVLEVLGEPGSSVVAEAGVRQDRYTHQAGNPILLIYRGEVLDEIGMAGRAP